MTTAKFFEFFFFLCGGVGVGVILGKNFSRWGEGMSKFLACGGTYVRHSRQMSDLTKIFPKTTFMMKSSCHKEVMENTFHVSKCPKSLC